MTNDISITQEKIILLASHLKDYKSVLNYVKNQKLSLSYYHWIMQYINNKI